MATVQNQEPDCKMTPGESLNLIWFLANVHASCLTPFMRRGFGTQAMAWNGLFAGALIIGASGASNGRGMLLYLAIWLIAIACQRARTLWLVYWKKVPLHSRYPGYPWLAMQIPFVKSEWVATCIVEPVICLATGWILGTVSELAGQFVMFGSVSLIVREFIERMIIAKRIQVVRDAEMEQRSMAERYRG